MDLFISRKLIVFLRFECHVWHISETSESSRFPSSHFDRLATGHCCCRRSCPEGQRRNVSYDHSLLPDRLPRMKTELFRLSCQFAKVNRTFFLYWTMLLHTISFLSIKHISIPTACFDISAQQTVDGPRGTKMASAMTEGMARIWVTRSSKCFCAALL